jgi:hypothetical protein
LSGAKLVRGSVVLPPLLLSDWQCPRPGSSPGQSRWQTTTDRASEADMVGCHGSERMNVSRHCPFPLARAAATRCG